MPSKAKLVTRSASTTSVTADSIPKGSGLTNAEIDSNLINLRDQSIAITDGTTTTDIESGETITFSGATVTGNTVTITGGGGGTGDANPKGAHYYNTITMTTSAAMTAYFNAGHDNFHYFKITNQPTSVSFNKIGSLPSRGSMTILVWNAGSGTVSVSFPGIIGAGNTSIQPYKAILYRVFALQDAIGTEKLWFQPSGAAVSYP